MSKKGLDQRFAKHIPALSENVADKFYVSLSILVASMLR